MCGEKIKHLFSTVGSTVLLMCNGNLNGLCFKWDGQHTAESRRVNFLEEDAKDSGVAPSVQTLHACQEMIAAKFGEEVFARHESELSERVLRLGDLLKGVAVSTSLRDVRGYEHRLSCDCALSQEL